MNGPRDLEELLAGVREHSMFEEEGEAQLFALPEPRFLFHLLDCEQCRDLAWAKLGAAEGVGSQSRAGAQAVEANREAEELLLELLALPQEVRLKAIQEPRFHQPSLIDLLLDAGEQAGRENDAQKAEDIALLAIALGDFIAEDMTRARFFRGCYLVGGAGRLAGNSEKALAGFCGAAMNLTGALERAAYCRGFAIVRWEQGRSEEAMALLRRAAELFGDERQRREEAACLALLGLVHVEEGALDRALGPLLRGCMFLDPEARHWLTVRCHLAAALCLAANCRFGEASSMLQRSWMHYPLVTDAAEQTVITWLEGKVASFLREFDQAEGLLGAARQGFLAAARWAEAGAVTLDLAALYVDFDKPSAVETLIEGLRQTEFGGVTLPGAPLFEVVAGFKEMEPELPPRMRAALLNAELLHRARRVELGPPPLPWV